jgi:hypothetical protein
MMKMNLTFLTAGGLATAATAILSLTVTPIQTVDASDSHSGTACRAANLNQAFDLKWDHLRVANASEYQRWVVCPATIPVEFLYNGTSTVLTYPASGTVYAWFAAPGTKIVPVPYSPEVRCIWRDIPNLIAGTGVEVTTLAAATLTPDAALPDVSSATFDLSSFDGFSTSTLTCRMDPLTGINAYQMYHAVP